MTTTRKRPGRLWLFFWGRRRRGFPGLLVGLVAAAVILGLTFALPRGPAVSYLLGFAFVLAIAALAFAALALAAIASLRPRGRR